LQAKVREAKVREADGSIKPGAPAPGSRNKKACEPAKRATAAAHFAGSLFISSWSWGWRPRLYAYARFAGSI